MRPCSAPGRWPFAWREAPHANPNAGTMEFSLCDPDGYHVTVNAAQ